MGRNEDNFVGMDQGPGQVPHDVQWSGHGGAGQGKPGSMVNEHFKLSTEFMSFSCMGKKKVTCQLPAGCKW